MTKLPDITDPHHKWTEEEYEYCWRLLLWGQRHRENKKFEMILICLTYILVKML